MALTPEEIRDVTFSTTRGFREGYSLSEVDAFLERVQAEVAAMTAELARLRVTPAAPEGDDNSSSAVRMLELAQRTADDHVASAHQQAERIIEEARQRIARITEEAEAERASLERRVEDLRSFEREYRARLRTFIEGQIEELEGRGKD